jgi:hypothetical protein
MPTNSNEKPVTYGHSFQKIEVEGILFVEIRNTIFEDPVAVGDTVDVFVLPDGRNLISKDPDGIRIREINSVYVLFDTDVIIKEE